MLGHRRESRSLDETVRGCGGLSLKSALRGTGKHRTHHSGGTRNSRARGQSVWFTYGGFDLLRSNDGPKVLEVNSSPGLEGIEKATGKNIAGLIYDHIETYVRPHAVPKQTRRRG